MTSIIRRIALAVGAFGVLAYPAGAGTIYLGSNGTGVNPLIQVLDTSGNFAGTFGANASSAAALDGLGHVYTVTPGDSSSTIYVYDAAQAQVRSFVFNSGLDNGNGPANYLTDLAWDGSGLWASAYNGFVYQLSSTGSVLSSFDTGVIDTGVTSDGTNLYTTSGLGLLAPSPTIYKRDLQGAVIATIDTGLNDTLGIGFDAGSGTFFVGGVDVVSHVAADGTLLGAFANDGFHTGLEVGDIGTGPGPGGEVPEPGTIALIGGGLLVLGWRRLHFLRVLPIVLLGSIVFAAHAAAAISITSLAPSTNSPAPVGTTITFTTTASDTSAGTLRYRYRVRYNGGDYSTIVNYGPSNTFRWTPSDREGMYDIEASVINRTTLGTASISVPFQVTSRVIGGTPVVTSTPHPLVALYSAPACAAGQMRVRFKNAAQVYWQSTSPKPCNGSTSMNFYIGGMYPGTTYTMRNDVINGPRVTTSSDVTFTTSSSSASLPTITVPVPLPPTASTTEPITLFSQIINGGMCVAVDPNGKMLWYLPGSYLYGTRPQPGGTFLTIYGLFPPLESAGFREYDMAGNIIKDTNVEEVNSQLARMGKTFTINTIHHDARRLPNGNYLMLGMTDTISDAQGGGPNSILGDVILVMNSNLEILWVWNSFEHLDVTRKAILGETCATGTAGCVVLKAATANDWTHGNSVALAPDGNLIYSARHQDLVYKIAYQNGAGDGHVIWRLGKDGDFTWNSTDPYPWQSHQHDVEYEGTSNVLSLYDNGNTRVAENGGHSRGLALQVDEANRAVTPLLSADLGVYSPALGSAQRLSNGNYAFGSGQVSTGSQSPEVNKTGSIVGLLTSSTNSYRTFRLRDLYSAPW